MREGARTGEKGACILIVQGLVGLERTQARKRQRESMGGLRSGVDKSKDWNSTSMCLCQGIPQFPLSGHAGREWVIPSPMVGGCPGTWHRVGQQLISPLSKESKSGKGLCEYLKPFFSPESDWAEGPAEIEVREN